MSIGLRSSNCVSALTMLAVDVEEMLAAERLRGAGDGFVERAMEIFQRVAAKRRVGDLGRHGAVQPSACQRLSTNRSSWRRRALIHDLSVEDRDRHGGLAQRSGSDSKMLFDRMTMSASMPRASVPLRCSSYDA